MEKIANMHNRGVCRFMCVMTKNNIQVEGNNQSLSCTHSPICNSSNRLIQQSIKGNIINIYSKLPVLFLLNFLIRIFCSFTSISVIPITLILGAAFPLPLSLSLSNPLDCPFF